MLHVGYVSVSPCLALQFSAETLHGNCKWSGVVLCIQVIPHSFGRRRPPVISSTSIVDVKVEMGNVLSDITVAQDMLGTKQEEQERTDLPPHPADEKYASLMADMEIIQPNTEEYRIIEKYCEARRKLSIHTSACAETPCCCLVDCCNSCNLHRCLYA